VQYSLEVLLLPIGGSIGQRFPEPYLTGEKLTPLVGAGSGPERSDCAPEAVFFGGNNYVAGRIGGHALARWGQKHNQGRVDAVLLLVLWVAGPTPEARMTGVRVGIKEILPALPESVLGP
jgi:ABC-type sugar transport system substrate-binding protein